MMARILYVEDNEDNVYLVQLRFETESDIELLIAGDGAEALRVTAEQKPDLILMDLNLPIMSGLEAARRVKSDPATSGIPIIALTANAMESDRARSLAHGMNDHLTKPITPGALRAAVDRWTAAGPRE